MTIESTWPELMLIQTEAMQHLLIRYKALIKMAKEVRRVLFFFSFFPPVVVANYNYLMHWIIYTAKAQSKARTEPKINAKEMFLNICFTFLELHSQMNTHQACSCHLAKLSQRTMSHLVKELLTAWRRCWARCILWTVFSCVHTSPLRPGLYTRSPSARGWRAAMTSRRHPGCCRARAYLHSNISTGTLLT